METKKASKLSWKHVVCCAVLLLIFVLTVGVNINAEGIETEEVAESTTSEEIPLRSNGELLDNNYQKLLSNNLDKKVELAGPIEEGVTEYNYIGEFITKYNSEIEFLCDTFMINYEDIINDLYVRHMGNEEFDETNVGLLENNETYESALYGLVEYFFDFQKKNPNKINNTWVPYTSDTSYIDDLIIYFTMNIYSNVSPSLALSIASIETGGYSAKYMLYMNNIFGGMGSDGLIKYRNIEYGVLSYIRMLSRNYIGKGLNTVESIGYVYCPRYDDAGNKIASPTWVSSVKTAMNKYNNYDFNVSLEDLRKDE